jgi:anti-anti-sigma factor
MQKQKIELNIPANLHFSSLVRNIAEEVFNFIHFSKEWANRLKLVVDELFMNAVKYGSKENESMIRIFFLYDDRKVEFRIEDDGTGTRKISAGELKALIYKNAAENSLTKTSGRGLALISSQWTDGLAVEESPLGGIAISFVKKIETMPPAPPQLVQNVVSLASEPARRPAKTEAAKERKNSPEFIIRLQGEIDQINIEKLALPVEEQIAALPNGAALILDFAKIEYINSTFIGRLASWYNSARKKNARIIIQNADSQIMDVLDLVGLRHVISSR